MDYYYVKKLAYHYIKRSQNPLCLMFDEPQDGKITLYGVNDRQTDAAVTYTVYNITGGGSEVLRGSAVIPANASVPVGQLAVGDEEKKFYLIEWTAGGKTYRNHFHTGLINVDYHAYLDALRKCGMDEFEGF